ncbi:EamA family transporter [Marinomonas sp. 15G1-11]|uniref:EamA family transporter n=1 Tax=Marinomonas phaeophyticola TaxID=3004091 RepID=A0ABT4JYR3_9GAMM|nr:EamA family transporter [Marinomonas sp. 15G1-11]MCZ2722898.1 EamA family transporter [Marinomonas sp. 15G1-11]
MSIHSQSRGELVLVLVTILAAFGWIFAKESIVEMPPLLFMGIRFLLAGIILVMLGKRFFRGLNFANIKKAMMVGGLGVWLWGFGSQGLITVIIWG